MCENWQGVNGAWHNVSKQRSACRQELCFLHINGFNSLNLSAVTTVEVGSEATAPICLALWRLQCCEHWVSKEQFKPGEGQTNKPQTNQQTGDWRVLLVTFQVKTPVTITGQMDGWLWWQLDTNCQRRCFAEMKRQKNFSQLCMKQKCSTTASLLVSAVLLSVWEQLRLLSDYQPGGFYVSAQQWRTAAFWCALRNSLK